MVENEKTGYGGTIMRSINEKRLLERLHTLGTVGMDAEGRRTRQAVSDEDRAGRDLVAGWMRDAGLKVVTDRIGNLFGIWETEQNKGEAPMMTGSHIDTVIDAGQYDGCYGVLSGLEVIQTLKESGCETRRPMVVCAFTNEEGVRYAPDLMGSIVFAGGYPLEKALAAVGTDGTILGEELKRIGYAGEAEPGFFKPHAFVELHIEQGPILDAEGIPIGAVENLQGISWQRITIEGVANHAGTTPTNLRVDAGLAAAKVLTFMRERCTRPGGRTVATSGCMRFEPNAVNVIPSKAVFTIDMRNPYEEQLKEDEQALADYLKELEETDKVRITAERMVRFEPVAFDERIVGLVEEAARGRGLSCRRMTSGAGQDAQMMSRICPTAMVFVPSVKGISHSPKEFTAEPDLIAGANVLLDVAAGLAGIK